MAGAFNNAPAELSPQPLAIAFMMALSSHICLLRRSYRNNF
jgi:hypothetical protein